MTEEALLPQEGTTVPPDEIIKLNCLQMAIDSRHISPLEFAKEMYSWVKESWVAKDKGISEITIQKDGETITFPIREVEVHA